MTTSSPARADAELVALVRGSAELIRRYQDPSGAYPASPTFSAYRGYSWFRDGAFIADAMSAYGDADSASRFHDWAAGVLLERSALVAAIVDAADRGRPVPDAGMLPTRFTLSGHDGADDWWDFQLDGYGTWLWALAEHAARHGLDAGSWSASIELAVDYLLSSWRRPCFDWWEEHAEHVHVSTLGCIAAGLEAVRPLLDTERAERCAAAVRDIRSLVDSQGLRDGHLVKWLGSPDVDASLLSLVSPLRAYPATGEIGRSTIAAIESDLEIDGGVIRYRGDVFYGGGRWPLLSCFLGLAQVDAGRPDRARELLRWAASTATADGELPEQVGGALQYPEHEQEWIDRWGTVATPLLWSHAMLVRLWVALEDAR